MMDSDRARDICEAQTLKFFVRSSGGQYFYSAWKYGSSCSRAWIAFLVPFDGAYAAPTSEPKIKVSNHLVRGISPSSIGFHLRNLCKKRLLLFTQYRPRNKYAM